MGDMRCDLRAAALDRQPVPVSVCRLATIAHAAELHRHSRTFHTSSEGNRCVQVVGVPRRLLPVQRGLFGAVVVVASRGTIGRLAIISTSGLQMRPPMMWPRPVSSRALCLDRPKCHLAVCGH
jgi:hypothetical protein